MIKINYYVGCNDKDTLKQEIPDNYFMTVFDICFDNFTVTQVIRKFINEKGLTTIEKTFIITLIVEDSSNKAKEHYISDTCRYLKTKFNQESILVAKEVIQANFY